MGDIDAEDSVSILKFIVNDPGNHVCADDVKYYRKDDSAQKEARTVYDLDNHGNLLKLIDNLKINRTEKFAIDPTGLLSISDYLYAVGPTEGYFTNLVPDLRNDLQKASDDVTEFRIKFFASSKTPEQLLNEEKDDPSTHNASSLIVLFTPDGLDGEKFLFLGDSTRESIETLPEGSWDAIKGCRWIKVPHHGSIHNLNTNIINHINPDIAYISASGNEKHPNETLVKVLKNTCVSVYSTHKGAPISYKIELPSHLGWSTAEPL